MAAMLLAKDHDVVLLEEHAAPGEPMHCAGLVTGRGVPEFARKSVVSEVMGAKLHSPLGFTLTLESRRTRACVLDRARFDRTLFERAVDEGATAKPRTRVTGLENGHEHVRLEAVSNGRSETIDASVVIGADGARSVCRRSAHLPQPKHLLRGLQTDLEGVDLDPDFVELYFGNRVAPGFFAWAIPAGDVARVGLCTWGAPHPPAVYLRKLLSWPQFSGGRPRSKASGLIPIGAGRTAASGRVMLVGDAACHAKPLSGGGVYTGVKGAELCAHVAHAFLAGSRGTSLGEYDTLWKEAFGRELARAFRIRKVFLKLTDKKLDKALRIFDEPEVRALLEERGDIDYPASLSHSVLKLAPKLAQFSPQIVESFL